MGNKFSRNVRRSHAHEAIATAIPAGTTVPVTATHSPCQDQDRPGIKSSSPLLIDSDSSAVASSRNPEAAAYTDTTMDNVKTENQLPSPIRFITRPRAASTGLAPPAHLRFGSPQDDLENVLPLLPPPLPPPPPTCFLPTGIHSADSEPPTPTEISCIICCEPVPKEQEPIYPCKCSTAYCTTCIKDMFIKACKNLSHMPPRCCNQIQLHFVRPYLTETEAAEFRTKYDEWSTPNPFYCPVPTCSAFIPPRIIQQAKTMDKGKQRVDSVVGIPSSPKIACPKCQTDVCTGCRGIAHNNSACEKIEFGVDEETAELLKSWGYKRCPKCGNGVRRMYGCNHMECFCGAHWCWVCQQSRDDCDGECFESEDEDSESYPDSEDEDENESEASPADGTNNMDGNTTGGVAISGAAICAGEGSAQEADPQATAPKCTTRPENLDGGSNRRWEESGLDFGDEPSDDIADRAWDCFHRFETVKATYADALRNVSTVTGMECTKCWKHVHAEIEMPPMLNPEVKLIAGNGRGRPRGRGRGYRVPPPRGLVRQDATVESSLSRSLPSEPMCGVEVASNNGDRVVDTYGNIITTTDFILGPKPPRRASFNFTAEPTMKLEPPVPISKDKFKFPTASINSASEAKTTFSMAHKCSRCGILVCSTCKEISADAMTEE